MPQSDRARLEQALRAADAAGDTQAAQRIAQEIRTQSQQSFVGPVATGEEMARSRAPQTEQAMRKLGLLEAAEMTGSPQTRLGLGAAEAALSIGTGMVSAPLNSLWNMGMEAMELPPGEPVGTYQPRTQVGQKILGGMGSALEFTRIPQLIEKGTDLQNPDPAVRATGHGINAVLGLAPGAAYLRRVSAQRAAIPTRTQIKAAAGEAYTAARASGEMLPQSGFGQLIGKAEKMLADEAYDPTQHPRTAAALRTLYEEGTRPGIQGFSPQGAEVVRRHLMNAEEAAIGDIKNPAVGTSADARLAAKLLDDFDDFMEQQLSKAGPKYREARALWSTQLKAAEIERLFERAQNQAGQYSVSGMENALRVQFKQLADNPRRFNRFNPQERAAIHKVVRGDLPQNWLQRLGKFSVSRGGVSAIPALVATALDPTLGAILALGGEASRFGSTALRTSRANAVDRLVRAGALPSMPGARGGLPATYTPGYLPAFAPAVSNALARPRDDDERRNALTR